MGALNILGLSLKQLEKNGNLSMARKKISHGQLPRDLPFEENLLNTHQAEHTSNNSGTLSRH